MRGNGEFGISVLSAVVANRRRGASWLSLRHTYLSEMDKGQEEWNTEAAPPERASPATDPPPVLTVELEQAPSPVPDATLTLIQAICFSPATA